MSSLVVLWLVGLCVIIMGPSAVPGEKISVKEAEGKYFLITVQRMCLMGYKNVVFESDCKSLVQNLNGDDNFFHIHNLSLGIRYWYLCSSGVNFCETKRK